MSVPVPYHLAGSGNNLCFVCSVACFLRLLVCVKVAVLMYGWAWKQNIYLIFCEACDRKVEFEY